MGQSTNAILCYGFSVGEEDDPPSWMEVEEEDEFDFDNLVLKHFGGDLSEPREFDEDKYNKDPEIRKAWAEYWAAKKSVVDGVGVTLVRHCSCDYPLYILAVKVSQKTASRGFPIVFEGDIIHEEEWKNTLETFCLKTGIPMQAPSWILCSDWC
jgi:hypothetical protein